MTWAVAAVAGATVVSGYMQGQAQEKAAQTQADAASRAQNQLMAAGQQASQQFIPYSNAGNTALANLASNNDYFNHQFNNQDLNSNLSPNFAFNLDLGQKSNLMANNATGGAVSGNALKSLQDYTQGYAGNAYQQAFNNYQTQRGNINAMNMSGAQLGLAGATGSANAQLGAATNVAGIGMSNANAQAASQIAQGNIYGGATNTLGNLAYMGINQSGNNLNNQNLGGYTPNEIAMGASPGGAYTPTAGNSFEIKPA